MKTAFSVSFMRSASVVLAMGVLIATFLQPAIAQTTVNPLDDSFSGDGRSSDPFSSGGNQSSSVLDLIHRITLGNGRSLSEYSSTQQENLGTEASDFRTRQLELLRQQNLSQPGTQDSSDSTEGN